MHNMIGITIGPIVETLQLAKTPAGLWYASYLFSWLSQQICQELGQRDDCSVLLPSFEETDQETMKGLGLYPDHIVVESDQIETIQELCETCRQRLIQRVLKDCGSQAVKDPQVKSFLENYFYVKVVEGADIRQINSRLDGAELDRDTILRCSQNYLLDILADNGRIKSTCLLGADMPRIFLNQNGNVRSIAEICQVDNSHRKYNSYFAVVQSDGDNMGKLASGLTTAEELTAFSRRCAAYLGRAVKEIQSYGGMVIYAGGDDLLFLAPCVGQDDTLLLELLQKIDECCQQVFSYYEHVCQDAPPAVSFGVSIQYHKFPLREALGRASHHLFAVAKRGEKNTVALHLEKHSRQGNQLVFPQIRKEHFRSIQESCQLYHLSQQQPDTAESSISSLLGKLWECDALFAVAEQQEEPMRSKLLFNLWNNKYDHTKEQQSLVDAVILLHQNTPSRQQLESVLRYVKFLEEDGSNESEL